MPQNYRQPDERPNQRNEQQDFRRRERMRTGEDRDPYQSGGERRYMSDRDDRAPQRGFEGERSYSSGGYPEEFGYRRDDRGNDQRSDQERRGQFTGQRSSGYSDFNRITWNDDPAGAEYYGVGRHFGGGYGTAPSSRASAAGAEYGGRNAWSGRESDWLPESGGRSATSGSRENFGQSEYGSQSGYGRDYGRSDRQSSGSRSYGGQSSGSGGDYRQNWIGGESQQPQRSSFRGRGPKGYERSDERLKELICERLTDDPRIDASEVSIEVNQKVVKLTGTVDDRRTKYEIEDLIEHCGVQDIDNQLRVQSSSSGLRSGESESGAMRAAGAKGLEGKSGGSAPSTKRT
ncbi:MAG: BON domain-containing protein [Steroidobacter sp.]